MNVQHNTCFSVKQPCPANGDDFRLHQCAEYNSQTHIYNIPRGAKWIPKYDGSKSHVQNKFHQCLNLEHILSQCFVCMVVYLDFQTLHYLQLLVIKMLLTCVMPVYDIRNMHETGIYSSCILYRLLKNMVFVNYRYLSKCKCLTIPVPRSGTNVCLNVNLILFFCGLCYKKIIAHNVSPVFQFKKKTGVSCTVKRIPIHLTSICSIIKSLMARNVDQMGMISV